MQKYLPPSTQCISNNPKNKFSKLFQTLVAISLFGLPIAPVWAGCAGNGDITGTNPAPLILGSGGCSWVQEVAQMTQTINWQTYF